MNRNFKLLLLLTLLGAWCEGAAAQVAVTSSARSARATLTLEQALQRSLRHNPEIGRLDAALADKLGRAIEAEVKLNPSFKLTGARTSEREGVGTEFELEIEQPLRPSDFGLRKTYAAALRAAATVEQQADVLRVLNATAVLFYRTWALQERAALLGAARGETDEARRSVQEQFAAGQSDAAQASIFEAEAARFSVDLLAVRAELSGAQAELDRATSLRTAGFQLAAPGFSPLPSARQMVAFAEARSGIRRIALAQRAAAASNLSVARADAVFPEFVPGLVTNYGSRNDSANIGVTIAGRLPLWDRNQGEITRARGALAAADRELASFDRVSLQRSIAARRDQVASLQARAAAYREKVIPAYRTAYGATLSQFRAGQATALQLFGVQRSLIEAQETAFEHAVEALSARTHLEQLIGGRIEEVGTSSGGKEIRSE